MAFNIGKYDNTTFSKDELTHKRIKALLLWFEYEVYKNDIPPKLQIKLMDKWLSKFESEEYYEVLPFFNKKRIELVNTYNDILNNKPIEEPVKVTDETIVAPFLTRFKNNVKVWYRVLFK